MNPFAGSRRWLFAGMVLLPAALAGLIGAQGHAQRSTTANAAAPAQVTSVLVQAQGLPVYRSGVGTVTAAQSVTVRTRIDGQLEKVAFTEGQDVRAGQLLATIDSRGLRAQLEQAKAQRSRDEAQLANARVDLRRYTELMAKEAGTQQQLDTQKALVAQLAATVQDDAAKVALAQVQLDYATITAPIGGRVGARLVDSGNIVRANDADGLVVIKQIDPIMVVFTLPGADVPQIIAAQRASRAPLSVAVYAPQDEQALATGELVLLNNQIDTSSGTITLKARFANPEHKLWPGQYVNVRLVLGRLERALTVPAAAVQRGAQGSFVYVVQADRTVRVQPVEVAQLQDGLAIITRGLAAGERVVVDGQYKLSAGVSVVEAPAVKPALAASAAAARP